MRPLSFLLRHPPLQGCSPPSLRSGLLPSFLVLMAPGLARAGEPLTRSLDVALRTDVPVLVGGAVTWEGPYRARARVTGGVMPGPYVDLTNAAMTRFDVYSDSTAEIIDSALRRSLVLRFEGGWRPLPKRGLTLGLGYQLLTLGGDSTDLGLYSEAADPKLLERAQGITGDLEVGITDHMLTAEVGYEWPIREHLLVGTSLGLGVDLLAASYLDD